MDTELSKNFEPQVIEEKWYQHWLNMGYFNSKPDGRLAYTIVIPPPNVTGVLHMGHTLNETVQDVLIRKARMSGFNACWVPGSDHASIATEAKVVQMLKDEKGISKNDLSRQDFLAHAFEWKEKYGGIIYQQIKKLGCSVDWNRVTFTMDDHYYKAVIKVFIDLYNKGLIYRGARMINWDPSAQTALSDEEVEHRDVQGKLYYVKYYVRRETLDMRQEIDSISNEPLSDISRLTSHDQFILIATQRPETIMGDTAVCVHPDDPRYQHLKGAKVIVPLVNREVPIIFDEYVDPAFGTGALKITPAHDINDYNLSLKHHLPTIDTLNEDGTLSIAAEVFVGMDRFDARKAVVQKLREEDLLVKEEDYTTRLGFSQRSNAVVEPRISTQWFVKMLQLAGKALTAVTGGDIKIHPEERFLATYKYWLENIKDWCISRQLWWGQRIPAWYDAEGRFVVAETENEAQGLFNSTFKIQNAKLHQDEDVLDTWFSSWLWPIEVFNGITQPGNPDINYYYPSSVLVTGQDIIFFWVARMIMAGEEYMKKKPFDDVYFTGMVRDKQGRKMSKQLGNSPDLLKLIDKYGADAVRFGILIAAPAGNDLLFEDSSCDQGKFFNNKLWNALKLVKMLEGRQSTANSQLSTISFATDWFENRLNEVHAQVEEMYKSFRLSEALKTIYSLIWDDFCSWYLEWVKPGFEQQIEVAVYQKTVYFFEQLMQLLHPFMPFVTEEIYHQLKEQTDDLCVKQFDRLTLADASLLKQGELLKQTISAIRDVRIKNNIKPKDAIKLHIQAKEEAFSSILSILQKQVNCSQINFVKNVVNNTITTVIGTNKFYIETEQQLNSAAQIEQLQKELEYHKGFLFSVEKKLSNERFVQNAKAEVVDAERKKKSDAEQKIKALEESLGNL
ncbi:MAG: valine--tRNA ligase [Bacteroidota bacterium]|nr:valine--tRNA ligase [Bacteroidota bacterium]